MSNHVQTDILSEHRNDIMSKQQKRAKNGKYVTDMRYSTTLLTFDQLDRFIEHILHHLALQINDDRFNHSATAHGHQDVAMLFIELLTQLVVSIHLRAVRDHWLQHTMHKRYTN